MAVTEEQRHDLYTYFDETMGRDRATVLMELLPPVGWGDVATKQFVETGFELSRQELKTEMAHLRTELKTEMADLRTELKTEMADLRTELKTEMADLRTEFKTEMADLRTEMADFRTEVKSEMTKVSEMVAGVQHEMYKGFNRHMVAIVTANVAYLGLTLATVKLFF